MAFAVKNLIRVFFLALLISSAYGENEESKKSNDTVDHLVPVRSAVFSPYVYEGAWFQLRECIREALSSSMAEEVIIQPHVIMVNFNLGARNGVVVSIERVEGFEFRYFIIVAGFETNSEYSSFSYLSRVEIDLRKDLAEGFIGEMEDYMFSTRQVSKGKHLNTPDLIQFFSVYVSGHGDLHGVFPTAENVSPNLQRLSDLSNWFWSQFFMEPDEDRASRLSQESVVLEIEQFLQNGDEPQRVTSRLNVRGGSEGAGINRLEIKYAEN